MIDRQSADRSEATSQASDEQYRRLLNSIDQGFCVIEMLFDVAGQPIDYRFLETNPAFENQSGLKNAVGRSMRELSPNHEEHWFEAYGRVAKTGQPQRFVSEAKTLDGRWFDVFAFRDGGPGNSRVAVLFRDVTEAKRADFERERLLTEIAAERERLADIFRHAPSFMCVLSGPNLIFTLANDRYRELVGHRVLLGKPAREALPEVEDQGFFDLLDKVYLSGEPYIGKDVPVLLQRVPARPPEKRFLNFVYQAVREPDGTIVGIFVQGVDLTERKLAEDELRASAERFRRAFDIETVGVIFLDTNRRITQANDAFLRMGSYDRADVTAGRLRWDELTPPEWMPHSLRAVAELEATGRTTPYEKEYFRSDGTRFSAIFAARRIAEHEIVEFVLDISDRKRAEAELGEKTERLDLLLENINDYAVIISDADDIIVEWQGGAERITGYTADELIGSKTDIIFTPEDRIAGHPQNELAEAAECGRAQNTRWHLRKDGSRFYADGVTVALRDEAGQLRGFGKVFRDATAQKEYEEALREADRRKDQFLATLAHELRNPLAPISNALEAWPFFENNRAETERMRLLIDRQVRQLIQLTNDLLDVSRISRGKIELRKQRVDLATVVEAALEAVQPFVVSCRHTLTLDTPEVPVALDADPSRLMQVVGNLVHNAAKYTGQNGHIWIASKRDGDDAVVSVRDNGPGLPPDMLDSIFEMFTQVDQTLSRSHGGLGIGLMLVKTLVELHGGTVTAFSKGRGHGSEFVVRLPAAASVAETDAQPKPPSSRSELPTHRVLVVDDVRPSANTLAMMLTGLGQQTRVAYDGSLALNIAAEFQPNVIILDIAMPGMDGYEVARRLRQSDGLETVLVALTGYGQEDDRRQAFDAGFDHHLVKPTSVDALHQLLATIPAEHES